MRRKGFIALLGLGVVLALSAAGFGIYSANYVASVPSSATPVVIGSIAAPVTAAVPDGRLDGAAWDTRCFDRLQRPEGSLDLCAYITRLTNDADPDKDYYTLEVHGSLFGAMGSGVRWGLFRVRPTGSTKIDDMIDSWPIGQYDGSFGPISNSVQWSGPGGIGQTLEASPRLFRVDPQSPDQLAVAWVSTGTVFPVTAARAISMIELVSVPEGGLPSFDVLADFGA